MGKLPQTERSVDTVEPRGMKAVVVGGSLSGLLAARVLADHFDRVTVLERGRFTQRPRPRRGVSQDRHVHILLRRGLQVLDRLFPGFSREMVTLGARNIDSARDLAVLTYHGWGIRYASQMRMLTSTRPLIDWCIYRRLAGHPRVHFRDECRAVGLDGDPESNRITGVDCQISSESSSRSRSRRTFPADLVVNATGRFSQLPAWLARLGYDRPEETVVDPFLGYATRIYEPPLDFRAPWKALVLLGKPPEQRRGGVLLPVEEERWVVTLAGINKDYPPTDETAFLAFARSLRSPILYEAIADARPISPIKGSRSTSNRIIHYESLEQWPDGLIALGDAVCALNPIYAQGMSVTALGVMCLDRMLRTREVSHDIPPGFTRRFQRSLARIHRTPWLMATGEDLRWPQTRGSSQGLLARVMHWYLDKIVALATRRKSIDRRFSDVVHMVAPPHSLLHPRVALPVLDHALRKDRLTDESHTSTPVRYNL